MDKKNIIIIILIIILIVLAIIVAGTFMNNNNNSKEEKKPVIYTNAIDGVGTFNSTNVTNFTSKDMNNGGQDYIGNDTITQITIVTSSADIEVSISEAEKVNDSAGKHTIYKDTANVGEHKGEVRYFSVLKDNDNQRYVFISSPDYNLTCMIVDTFKFSK